MLARPWVNISLVWDLDSCYHFLCPWDCNSCTASLGSLGFPLLACMAGTLHFGAEAVFKEQNLPVSACPCSFPIVFKKLFKNILMAFHQFNEVLFPRPLVLSRLNISNVSFPDGVTCLCVFIHFSLNHYFFFFLLILVIWIIAPHWVLILCSSFS